MNTRRTSLQPPDGAEGDRRLADRSDRRSSGRRSNRRTRPTREGHSTRRTADVFERSPDEIVSAARYLINTRDLAGQSEMPSLIGVTSAARRDGRTTVARALATALAEDLDASVCLADLSWARDDFDGVGSDPGIIDVIGGDAALDDALVVDENSGYTVLHAGGPTNSPHHALVRSDALETAIDDLRDEFDHVVFDMPPVLTTGAGLPTFRFVDGYVLVVRAGTTRTDQIQSAVWQLREVEHLGSVLNRESVKIPRVLRRLITN